MASTRKRNNRIQGIMVKDLTWKKEEAYIMKVFLDYFNSIFTTSRPTNMELVYRVVENRLSEEMNDSLVKEFTKGEIQQAFEQMNLDKALRLDEMTGCFYKRY